MDEISETHRVPVALEINEKTRSLGSVRPTAEIDNDDDYVDSRLMTSY